VIEGRAGVWHLLKRFVQWRVRPQRYLVALGINMLVWLLAYTAESGTSVVAPEKDKGGMHHASHLP